jgi:glucose/arabinose dehydrogenase
VASNPGDEPLALQPVALDTSGVGATGNFTVERTVNLPQGFAIKVFATGLPHVRKLAFSPDGVLFATVRAEDRIVSLPDANGDGVADEAKTFADGMEGVHGLAFRNGSLYAATETTIYRLTDTDGDRVADEREELVTDLPTGGVGRAGGNHTTRTIIFGPVGKAITFDQLGLGHAFEARANLIGQRRAAGDAEA